MENQDDIKTVLTPWGYALSTPCADSPFIDIRLAVGRVLGSYMRYAHKVCTMMHIDMNVCSCSLLFSSMDVKLKRATKSAKIDDISIDSPDTFLQQYSEHMLDTWEDALADMAIACCAWLEATRIATLNAKEKDAGYFLHYGVELGKAVESVYDQVITPCAFDPLFCTSDYPQRVETLRQLIECKLYYYLVGMYSGNIRCFYHSNSEIYRILSKFAINYNINN